MKNYHLYIIYTLVAILFGVAFHLHNSKEKSIVDYNEVIIHQSSGEEMKILIPEAHARIFAIPEKISFSGEKVPMDLPDVRERFEREIYVNAYWQSNMILLMKRANKFLPIIEEILLQNGIPEDFKYLAMVESGLLNVASPAGARGFWQFMPETAKENKLEVNDDVDERYHLEKSTLAATRYLKASYGRFGNWTSVAASYNMGMSGLGKRKVEQKMTSYYDLLLNEETSRYLFRILAFKEIFEHPSKYGFKLVENDLYRLPNFRELKVTQSIPNLADWALRHNTNYKELKIHNPWLRSSKLTVANGKEYILKIPVN
ncbi:lytic transglycosylase domain-containing protein [Rhodonellum sp.]|uniref:lytic transglycosylase domain-containing protein n=1 Tax=Rhodonellum sp. TaxID=2231180 RepID=UPI002720D2FA|nr:lytic transglycosylase domain-containing protein [Rhodonellum sp.]MDO9552599.1 lytic transglycosylase domain-containing protein [Rhodonellum sp.]